MTESARASAVALEAVCSAIVNAFNPMSIDERLEVIASHGHVVVDNNEMPEFANIDGEWVSFDELDEWFFANSEYFAFVPTKVVTKSFWVRVDELCHKINDKHIPLICPTEEESVSMDNSIGDSCPNCGGSMIGDGYTVVRHCEYADSAGYEPDAEAVLCHKPTVEETKAFMARIDKLCDKIDQNNDEKMRQGLPPISEMEDRDKGILGAFHRMSIDDQLEVIVDHGFAVVLSNEMPSFASIDGEWVSLEELGSCFVDLYSQYRIADRVFEEAPRGDEAEKKRKEDFARQENIMCALSALCLLVLVVIPFIVFGEV